jgi:uncharacterized protein (DUF2141 family)
MKKLILIIAIILGRILTTNAQEKTYNLTINITGLSSNKGNVLVALYDKKEAFLKKSFKGGIVKIIDKQTTYIFKDIPKGEYAVSFFHDENNNNKMDTNFIGIPKEDYGFSNNTKGFIRPPKYNDAKFQLTKNKTINLNI